MKTDAINCPHCRGPVSKCSQTGLDENGVRVRIRRCQSCFETFWTAQEPEYVVPVRLRAWRSKKPIILDEVANPDPDRGGMG